jgi:hypothetical protein
LLVFIAVDALDLKFLFLLGLSSYGLENLESLSISVNLLALKSSTLLIFREMLSLFKSYFVRSILLKFLKITFVISLSDKFFNSIPKSLDFMQSTSLIIFHFFGNNRLSGLIIKFSFFT